MRKANRTSFKSGKDHPNYKGGKVVSSGNGKVKYKKIKINGKYILEHRWIMEQVLGRKLRKGEVVHHKNKNGLDNRIENLVVMSKKDHDLLGQNGRRRKDLICGHKDRKHHAYGRCKSCDSKERMRIKNGYYERRLLNA